MPQLVVHNVSRAYGAARALDGFSLAVEAGETLAVLGPSGSGKSTLLRVIAGLEAADSGSILFEGRDLARSPTHARGFGLMFQDYCLFPHLGVRQNIEFGLRMRHVSRARRRERVQEMLRLVRLEGFAGRDVLTLSGGEQQRVALARSLAPSPRLLMLDEPLGALDASLRVTLLAELGDILRQVGITVLYVTHDQAEAMTIASRIALIDAGKLMQAGPPAELIRSPANAFVASFLGLGALVPAWELGMDLDMKVLVRPAAVRMSPAAGHVPAQARLISRMVRPQGSTLRIGIRGRAGAEYPLEITVPPLGSHERWDPGSLRPVWIDPLLCQPLSR